MYTQCPDCQTYRTVSVKELSKRQAIIRCHQCKVKFDALLLLKDGKLPKKQKKSDGSIPPVVIKKLNIAKAFYWQIGTACCLVLLGIQFIYFEMDRLSQQTRYRTWLQKTCQIVSCQLPAYDNKADIIIINATFNALNKQAYLFEALFMNQATFPQHFPRVQLSLKSFTGEIFAQRIFYPHEYLQQKMTFFNPNQPTAIKLSISAPNQPIGGYHFELI